MVACDFKYLSILPNKRTAALESLTLRIRFRQLENSYCESLYQYWFKEAFVFIIYTVCYSWEYNLKSPLHRLSKPCFSTL